MNSPEFVYTIYIRTTPEKVWDAITNPEFTRKYWGHENISDWEKGAEWRHVSNDKERTVKLVGRVLECVPPKRLVLTWADPAADVDESEHSIVTFEIDSIEDMVRLRVIHGNLKAGSEMALKISEGWPRVLSSMKSILETGKPLNTWAGHEHGCVKAETK